MRGSLLWSIGLLILSLCAFGSGSRVALSADQQIRILDLQFSTRDLDFKIEDPGGKVQNLKVEETATKVQIDLSGAVLFEFDKDTLLPAAQDALRQAADVIRASAKGKVLVAGFTDSKGSASYNQKLSLRRAKAVVAWLIKREGLVSVKFDAKGHGAKNPVAPNSNADGSDNPEGRQQNRRVEVSFGK